MRCEFALESLARGSRSRVPPSAAYADALAAALLTGLGAALGPASRLRRRYADAPAGAFFFATRRTSGCCRILFERTARLSRENDSPAEGMRRKLAPESPLRMGPEKREPRLRPSIRWVRS